MAVNPLNMFFTAPEYQEWCTESQLKEKYDVTFQESGWYELKNSDFLLIIERHGKYKVFLWVGVDPMEEMEKVLDLPKFD